MMWMPLWRCAGGSTNRPRLPGRHGEFFKQKLRPRAEKLRSIAYFPAALRRFRPILRHQTLKKEHNFS
jgi:hypothetical protein